MPTSKLAGQLEGTVDEVTKPFDLLTFAPREVDESVNSDCRWIQHHPNGCTEGFCWKIAAKLRSHHARVSMRPSDFAPDDTNFGSPHDPLRVIDECDLLAEIETCGLGVIHALDFDETGPWVCITLSTLVA